MNGGEKSEVPVSNLWSSRSRIRSNHRLWIMDMTSQRKFPGGAFIRCFALFYTFLFSATDVLSVCTLILFSKHGVSPQMILQPCIHMYVSFGNIHNWSIINLFLAAFPVNPHKTINTLNHTPQKEFPKHTYVRAMPTLHEKEAMQCTHQRKDKRKDKRTW